MSVIVIATEDVDRALLVRFSRFLSLLPSQTKSKGGQSLNLIAKDEKHQELLYGGL